MAVMMTGNISPSACCRKTEYCKDPTTSPITKKLQRVFANEDGSRVKDRSASDEEGAGRWMRQSATARLPRSWPRGLGTMTQTEARGESPPPMRAPRPLHQFDNADIALGADCRQPAEEKNGSPGRHEDESENGEGLSCALYGQAH